MREGKKKGSAQTPLGLSGPPITANCEMLEQLGSRCSSAVCLFVAYTKAKYTGSIRLLRTFDEDIVTKILLTDSGMCL